MSTSVAWPFIAADKKKAAESVGLSTTTLDAAVNANEMVAHYPTGSKPVYLATDLQAWIESSPTEKASR